MLIPLEAVGLVVTVLMAIDCAINRRDLMWFFVLLLLGPFWGIGAAIYIVYNYRSITFPFRLSGLRTGGGSKVCPRCFRGADHLEPYVDGRTTRSICTMCRAEMDITRADSIKFK